MADKYIMPEIEEAKRLAAELRREFEEWKAKAKAEGADNQCGQREQTNTN